MATPAEIQAHYDLDNEFYALFLDRAYRVYSCGVWAGAESLEDAQSNKLERIARFAQVGPDHSVLDVGCGWGGMMRYCLENRGARRVVGLTLSKAQYDYVQAMRVPTMTVRLESWADYDRPADTFDSVVSIGAFEHFATLDDRRRGRQHEIYSNFFRRCAGISRPRAHLGLQTIVTVQNPDSEESVRDARFLLTQIFLGTALPRLSEIRSSMAGVYEEVDSAMIGRDYAQTISHWEDRFHSHAAFIVARYGRAVFDRYAHYFVAAGRSFRNGYVDLCQVSLRSLRTLAS